MRIKQKVYNQLWNSIPLKEKEFWKLSHAHYWGSVIRTDAKTNEVKVIYLPCHTFHYSTHFEWLRFILNSNNKWELESIYSKANIYNRVNTLDIKEGDYENIRGIRDSMIVPPDDWRYSCNEKRELIANYWYVSPCPFAKGKSLGFQNKDGVISDYVFGGFAEVPDSILEFADPSNPCEVTERGESIIPMGFEDGRVNYGTIQIGGRYFSHDFTKEHIKIHGIRDDIAFAYQKYTNEPRIPNIERKFAGNKHWFENPNNEFVPSHKETNFWVDSDGDRHWSMSNFPMIWNPKKQKYAFLVLSKNYRKTIVAYCIDPYWNPPPEVPSTSPMLLEDLDINTEHYYRNFFDRILHYFYKKFPSFKRYMIKKYDTGKPNL